MALSPQLLQFKSSGVYRLEFDKSQTVNIPAETIRLVVGRSKKRSLQYSSISRRYRAVYTSFRWNRQVFRKEKYVLPQISD